MPRSFDLAATYEYTAAEVHAAFSEKQYWLARLEKSGCDEISLDVLETGADGGIEVVTTQTVRPTKLPALVTQFHRGDLTLIREERWTPLRGADSGTGRATATIKGDLPGTPARVAATATLFDTTDGARGDVHVTIEVKIPLVGGKLENFIGGHLVEMLRLEQVFTSEWIREHG
ncbi:DUF2505 domain-containing protein [Mycolicibacterium cosmeticum]|uniref:DUF2505 domain-containing protein n=1 Tax=Mycolicibacterium cosmeticum TaxID=258533 RepID=W9BLD9_MYCCO|nr:DUF2505 domain-containing protein [Mycolicibacterium cosmeticum]TLH74812.1 DUF2505 domain-containing protein [Mycolicibacterium cosmeticum]CDO09480.1 hypothetical protein BN977_04303 [Mycolicibacterium cosmeticum]